MKTFFIIMNKFILIGITLLLSAAIRVLFILILVFSLISSSSKLAASPKETFLFSPLASTLIILGTLPLTFLANKVYLFPLSQNS